MATSGANRGINTVVLDEGTVERIASRVSTLLQQQRGPVVRNTAGAWIPRMDVYLDFSTDTVIALFELPGVRREDIIVTVGDGKVNVEGDRSPIFRAYSSSAGNWLERDPTQGGSANADITARPIRKAMEELRYGQFKRTVHLPANVTVAHVRVVLYNGILHVQWPREVAVEAEIAPQQPAVKDESAEEEDPRPSKRIKKD
ncbi:hypothetical protein VNI00_017721 [Paramarasmius palmivorus]|uniref:SHSP domain-containing protein n=1 Tax=Paramarasmius palmivorus TaxID=297713 RepID=A0AAW0B3M9_9AGAR